MRKIGQASLISGTILFSLRLLPFVVPEEEFFFLKETNITFSGECIMTSQLEFWFDTPCYHYVLVPFVHTFVLLPYFAAKGTNMPENFRGGA